MKDSIAERIRHDKRRQSKEPLCAYYYDLEALRQWVRQTVSALPVGCRYFYAVKANSDRKILEALRPIVYGFEAASLGEVKKIRGISRQCPILFGGPGKTDEEIEGAIRLNVKTLHIESMGELLRTDRIAARLGKKIEVLIRVNLNGPLPNGTLQMCGVPSQFGIEENAVPAAIKTAINSTHIDLRGFHFHSVSNQLDEASHTAMIEVYLNRAFAWQEQFGFKLSYLNAGGGIGINYERLDNPFNWSEFTNSLPLLLSKRSGKEMPELWFECGRYTTASSGYYAAEVLDIKRIHNELFAVINGGLHHFLLPGAWKHKHAFSIIPVDTSDYPLDRDEINESMVTIVGRMNSPRDILLRDAWVQRLRVGDILVFPYAGAYGWSISAHSFSSLEKPEFVYLN